MSTTLINHKLTDEGVPVDATDVACTVIRTDTSAAVSCVITHPATGQYVLTVVDPDYELTYVFSITTVYRGATYVRTVRQAGPVLPVDLVLLVSVADAQAFSARLAALTVPTVTELLTDASELIMRYLARLEFGWDGAGTWNAGVPAGVRRCAVLLAVWLYDLAAVNLNMSSEALGDYSYSRGLNGQLTLPTQLSGLLAMYRLGDQPSAVHRRTRRRCDLEHDAH